MLAFTHNSLLMSEKITVQVFQSDTHFQFTDQTTDRSKTN